MKLETKLGRLNQMLEVRRRLETETGRARNASPGVTLFTFPSRPFSRPPPVQSHSRPFTRNASPGVTFTFSSRLSLAHLCSHPHVRRSRLLVHTAVFLSRKLDYGTYLVYSLLWSSPFCVGIFTSHATFSLERPPLMVVCVVLCTYVCMVCSLPSGVVAAVEEQERDKL